MLDVQNLRKSFGGQAGVDDVTLAIDTTAITAVIGPNGAGKSTLFNLIAGTISPDAGSIHLNGQRIDRLPPHRIFARGLARTFQIPRPFPSLTVLENLMLVGGPTERFYANWISPTRVLTVEMERRDRARALLDFVTLGRLADEKAAVLSGGQQKLLELARVMMAEPRIVLLDEPAAGVNPGLLDVLVDRIVQLHQDGVGFVLIEHNMDLVTDICDPVVVMAQGRVLARGKASDVRQDQRVVDAYLGDPS